VTSAAHAGLDAVDALGLGLTGLDTGVAETVATAGRALGQAHAAAQDAVAVRRAGLVRQQQALAACRSSRAQPPPDCGLLAVAVTRARARLLAAEQAVRMLEQAMIRHQAAQTRLRRESGELITVGSRLLAERRRELERVLDRSPDGP
jgi:hypothetical protein